jgi:hypothetical protein
MEKDPTVQLSKKWGEALFAPTRYFAFLYVTGDVYIGNMTCGVRSGWGWLPRPWTQLTADSGVGDPRAATPEKGAAFVAQALARTEHALAVEDVVARPPLVGDLGQLRLRERFGVLVVAVQRPVGGMVLTPGPEEHVAEGDTLVIIGSSQAVARVRAARA